MDGKEKQRSENIVAQFNIVDTPSRGQNFLEEYNHCPLCGSELVFTHVTNFVESEVKEEAFCMACNVRTKTGEHSLQ